MKEMTDTIDLRPFSTRQNFPRGATFSLFKDQLAGSGHQKTKENIIPCGKFHLVENGLNTSNHRRSTHQ